MIDEATCATSGKIVARRATIKARGGNPTGDRGSGPTVREGLAKAATSRRTPKISVTKVSTRRG